MKKKIILCALIMVLFFSADVSAESRFKDLKETAWYYTYVKDLVDAKVIDGMPDGTFQGQKELNADQLLKLMVTTINPYASYERELGKKENGEIVKLGSWFDPYLSVLQAMHIIVPEEKIVQKEGYEYKSTENMYSSYYNKPITREEVAYWILQGYNFARSMDDDYDKVSDEEIDKALKTWYKDADSIDEKYKKAVYILHECQGPHPWEIGIMTGGDDGGFWPKKTLTRAEATAVIWRLQHSRYVLLEYYKINYDLANSKPDVALRVDENGKQYWEKVAVKNGYVFSHDGNGDTTRTDLTGGTIFLPSEDKEIDLSDNPLVDGADTPERGEQDACFSDAEWEIVQRMAEEAYKKFSIIK